MCKMQDFAKLFVVVAAASASAFGCNGGDDEGGGSDAGIDTALSGSGGSGTSGPESGSDTSPGSGDGADSSGGGGETGGSGGEEASALDLPRIPWEGGPAYYKKFPKADAAGWDEPEFFPISVFLGKPSHAPQLQDVGVNTFMGAEHDGSAISTITALGMFVIAQEEWTQAELGDNSAVVGWVVSDECDMGLGCGGNDQYESLANQEAILERLRGYDDGRFMFANYANGLLHTYWAYDTMDEFMQIVDVASADKYFYTSPHVWDITDDSPYWPSGATVASSGSYGWLVDQMKKYLDPADLHPNWMFVEVARPYLSEDGSLVIGLEQLEGAVWNAIIHEARGIAYFQHSNDPTCEGYALVDCEQARKDKVRDVNAKIKSLAPVLNTQSYQYDFGNGTETMLKTWEGSAYIFAGIGLTQSPGSKTFVLPEGIDGTSVTVVGEDRTIPVTDGSFSDDFAAEYTHHVYEIALD